MSQRGGGGEKKKTKMSQIQFRTFENRWEGFEFFKNVSNLNWEQGTAREGLNFSKMSRLKSTCTLIRSWEKFEAKGGQPHVHTPPLPLYGRCLKGPVHTSKW